MSTQMFEYSNNWIFELFTVKLFEYLNIRIFEWYDYY